MDSNQRVRPYPGRINTRHAGRALAVSVGLMSCAGWASDGPAAPASSGAPQVRIVGSITDNRLIMKFEPATVTVPAGTTVTWVNQDGSNHFIKFSGHDSGRLKHHASYSHRFQQPGEYPYACAIHPSMTGTVIVD